MATAKKPAATKRTPAKTRATPAADEAFVQAAAAGEAHEAAAASAISEPVQPALGAVIGPSGVDGIPARYADGRQWLLNGVRRQKTAALAALFFSWTGFWIALWGAVIGACLGALVGLGAIAGHSFGHGAFHVTFTGAAGPVTVLTGLALGLFGGFFAVIGLIVYEAPLQWVAGMVMGLVVALGIVIFGAAFERLFLRLRGYRRLTRDEVRRIAPLVKQIAEGMDLDGLPRFAMADQVLPNAWAHMRTIVLTSGLLQTMDDGELRGVIAHELHHWREGHSVGLHLVWSCAWPIAIACNVGLWIAGVQQSEAIPMANRYRRGAILTFAGWFIAWPAWVIIRYALVPLMAKQQRQNEYEADAAAAQLGYSASLSTALEKMGAFESGRTGWETAMAATHPPVALRVEALQPPRPDDPIYQEDELHGPHFWRRVKTSAPIPEEPVEVGLAAPEPVLTESIPAVPPAAEPLPDEEVPSAPVQADVTLPPLVEPPFVEQPDQIPQAPTPIRLTWGQVGRAYLEAARRLLRRPSPRPRHDVGQLPKDYWKW